MTGHSACGCAACRAAAAPPLPIGNRPGLPSIRYRSGTHGDFLSAMIAGLSRDTSPRLEPVSPATVAPQPHEARPALRGLRTRDADDTTIALLDAFAVTADILTFYSERLANEAYLGTATDRTSLQELGALVAYRLGRGAAAETVLAFSLERPPAPLPAPMKDPGIAPATVPTTLTLPVGLRVQSIPGPDEQPQTFETVEQIEARPEWNALPVARTVAFPAVAGPQEIWFAGTALALSAGDTLLFTGTTLTSPWEIRRVAAIEVEATEGRTHVSWTEPLASTMPPALPLADLQVFVFRRRLNVFGHSAPDWFASDPNGPTFEQPSSSSGFTAMFTFFGVTAMYVDGSHPEVTLGSWLVAEAASASGRYRVDFAAELALAAWGVSGQTTLIGALSPALSTALTPRQVVVHAAPELLTVAEAPDASALAGTTIVVDGDATGMAKGRTIVLAGTDAAGAPVAEPVTVDKAEPVGALVPGHPSARTKITLVAPPAHAPTRATAVVYGNAARATHGESVTQLLGAGDARIPFAAYRVQQAPLTFVRAATPRGTASTLEVRVDDVLWKEVATTASAGPTDRVYETRDEPDGGISVVFGDGARGARPSTGAMNVRARYRKGAGVAGNVRRDQLGIALDRPLGLKGVSNPAPAVGGVDPETAADAQRAIPIPVRTLGRTVSLLDYADFSLAFAGIGKAQAAVLPVAGGGSLIVVTVADASGAAPPAQIVARLEKELVRWGDPLVRVAVVPVRRVDFRIALKVDTDPDRERAAVLAALEAALRTSYGAPTRDLGEPVHASEIVAAAASVVGVVGIDLDLLHRGSAPSLAKRLVAAPAALAVPDPLGAELLVLDPAPFPPLLEMP